MGYSWDIHELHVFQKSMIRFPQQPGLTATEWLVLRLHTWNPRHVSEWNFTEEIRRPDSIIKPVHTLCVCILYDHIYIYIVMCIYIYIWVWICNKQIIDSKIQNVSKWAKHYQMLECRSLDSIPAFELLSLQTERMEAMVLCWSKFLRQHRVLEYGGSIETLSYVLVWWWTSFYQQIWGSETTSAL